MLAINVEMLNKPAWHTYFKREGNAWTDFQDGNGRSPSKNWKCSKSIYGAYGIFLFRSLRTIIIKPR
jgi:hypothetical protein